MTPIPSVTNALLPGLLLLAACAGTSPYKPPLRERPTEPAQKKLFVDTMNYFVADVDEFDASIVECQKDPVVGAWVARELLSHMFRAKKAQQGKQGKSYALRTLEQNPRFVRARKGLISLGTIGTKTVIVECMPHPAAATRELGAAILGAMPDSELPLIVAGFTDAPEKFRHDYVIAVALMKPSPRVEARLLQWSAFPEWRVRAHAMAGLAKYGDKHLDRLLHAVAKDDDRFVQRKIVQSLGAIKTRKVAATVVEFYTRQSAARNREGVRAAERAMIRISGNPATRPSPRGPKRRNYGLSYWHEWLRTMPESKSENTKKKPSGETRGGR